MAKKHSSRFSAHTATANSAKLIVCQKTIIVQRYILRARQIFLFGGFFNAYIASFNLVPLGILDGHKIFNWSKIIWGLAFVTSAALTAIGYIMYSQYLQ